MSCQLNKQVYMARLCHISHSGRSPNEGLCSPRAQSTGGRNGKRSGWKKAADMTEKAHEAKPSSSLALLLFPQKERRKGEKGEKEGKSQYRICFLFFPHPLCCFFFPALLSSLTGEIFLPLLLLSSFAATLRRMPQRKREKRK